MTADAAFETGRRIEDEGRGDPVAAAEWYERAAEHDHAGALYSLAFIREDQGDHATARRHFRRAAELGHGHAAQHLGRLLRQAGDPGSARFWYELPTGLRAYSPRFEGFAADVAVAAILRQRALDAATGDGAVHYDLDARTWTAGERVVHGLSWLGSFSRADRTWLWSWQNPGFAADHAAVVPLQALRRHGRAHDIPELTAGRLPLGGFPDPQQAATTLAIMASTILGGNGVRACAINGGAGLSYFHLDDPDLPPPAFDPARAAEAVLGAVAAFPADPRRVVRAYVERHAGRIRIGPDRIEGQFAGGQWLKVAFTPDGAVRFLSSESSVPNST